MSGLIKTQDRITPSLDRINKDLDGLVVGAYKEWVDNTPVRTGNARRKTRLERGSRNGQDQIRANYDYAVPLDRGYSKKSPQGMSKPTETWLRRALRRIMRR